MEKDAKKFLIACNEEQAVKDLDAYIEKVAKATNDVDAKSQMALVKKWTTQMESDFREQTRNNLIEAKKKLLLDKLDEYEKREEIMTYFDREQEILNMYYLKGFPEEPLDKIPIEPDQTDFNLKYERNFKPWPKYMNRPPSSLKPSEEEEYAIESLRKIYLNNQRAQTSLDTKLRTSFSKSS